MEHGLDFTRVDKAELYGQHRARGLINCIRKYSDFSRKMAKDAREAKEAKKKHVSSPNGQEQTPMQGASGDGSPSRSGDTQAFLNVAKYILTFDTRLPKANCNLQDPRHRGSTPFMIACQEGQGDVVDVMLKEQREIERAESLHEKSEKLYLEINKFVNSKIDPNNSISYQYFSNLRAPPDVRYVRMDVRPRASDLKINKSNRVVLCSDMSVKAGIEIGDEVLQVGATRVKSFEHWEQLINSTRLPFIIILSKSQEPGSSVNLGGGIGMYKYESKEVEMKDRSYGYVRDHTSGKKSQGFFGWLFGGDGWCGRVFRGGGDGADDDTRGDSTPSTKIRSQRSSGNSVLPKLKERVDGTQIMELYERVLVSGIDIGGIPRSFMVRIANDDLYDSLLKFYHKPEECMVSGNIDKGNYDGDTSLMEACRAGHLNIVRRLIVNKAQIEAKNDQRWTAAMYAADAGHLHCLWYIWASIEEGHWEHLGAPESRAGLNTLSYAVLAGHFDCVRFIVEHVYEASGQPDEKVDSKIVELETKQIFKIGRSHAMMALYRGHNQILKYLLSKGFKCGILKRSSEASRQASVGDIAWLHPRDLHGCPNNVCTWEPRDLFQPINQETRMEDALQAWADGIVLRERRTADWKQKGFQNAVVSDNRTAAETKDHLLPEPRLTVSIIKLIRDEMLDLARRGLHGAALDILTLGDETSLMVQGGGDGEMIRARPLTDSPTAYTTIKSYSDLYPSRKTQEIKPGDRINCMAREIRANLRHYHDLRYALANQGIERRTMISRVRNEMIEGIAKSYHNKALIDEKQGHLMEALMSYQLAYQFDSNKNVHKTDLARLSNKLLKNEQDPTFRGRFHTQVLDIFDALVEVNKSFELP